MAETNIIDLLNDLSGPEHTLLLGPLTLYVRRVGPSWKVSIRREPEMSDRWSREDRIDADVEDGKLKWTTFAARSDQEVLTVQPTFPALPVVIRPHAPTLLRPADKVPFFVSIPLSVRICSALDTRQVLLEEPTKIMSKTWFGTQENGELCLASRTFAMHDLAELDHLVYRIICPVRMRNQSDEVLPFDRFCLHPDALDLYAGPTRFWSNELGITYKGPDEPSRVVSGRSAPSFDSPMQKIQAGDPKSHELSQLKSFFGGVTGL